MRSKVVSVAHEVVIWQESVQWPTYYVDPQRQLVVVAQPATKYSINRMLRWHWMLRQIRGSMLECQTLHEHVASETIKIQSSHWRKWCFVYSRYIISRLTKIMTSFFNVNSIFYKSSSIFHTWSIHINDKTNIQQNKHYNRSIQQNI